MKNKKYWLHFYNHVGNPDMWTGYSTNHFEEALDVLKSYKTKVCLSRLMGNEFKYIASNVPEFD